MVDYTVAGAIHGAGSILDVVLNYFLFAAVSMAMTSFSRLVIMPSLAY
jgi:hypothetical protein